MGSRRIGNRMILSWPMMLDVSVAGALVLAVVFVAGRGDDLTPEEPPAFVEVAAD